MSITLQKAAPIAPRRTLDDIFVLSDADRNRGLGIHAGSGSGKSEFLGKVLCFQDLWRGVPQVVFDPHGPLVDALLVQLGSLGKKARRKALKRLVYVDMSGRGSRVAPFPLLFRLPGENLRDVANRFLVTLRKLDPNLATASVQGWNALLWIGEPTLMILAALNLPITSAEDLLHRPESWSAQLAQAGERFPEAAAAAGFFRNKYMPLRLMDRISLSRMFTAKIGQFSLDPIMGNMFGTTDAGIELQSVVDNGLTLLLDFRHETNIDRRRFKTRWMYEWMLAYIKHRGTGKHTPLGLVIDELTELTNQRTIGDDLFAQDLDELISVYSRNYGMWLALAHQELFQLSPQTQKTLLTLGTQVFGVTADIEAAKMVAEQFCSLDPMLIKDQKVSYSTGPFGGPSVDEQNLYMPLEEQVLLGAQELMGLQPFEFLIKPRNKAAFVRVSTKRFVEGRWASDHAEELAYVRQYLARRTGVPIVRTPLEPIVANTAVGRSDTMRTDTYAAAEQSADYRTDEHTDDDWATPRLW